MAYMKSLTVSGQTYQVKDPDAVSFAEDQSLTAEQQTRARKNLDVWSAGEAMDRLCPSFTESGAVVRCEPVEGYPLEVEWQTKNLIDPAKMIEACDNRTTLDGDVFTTRFENGGIHANCATSKRVYYPKGTYTFTFIPLTEGANAALYCYARDGSSIVSNKKLSASNTSYTFTANEDFAPCLAGNVASIAAAATYSYKLQLEAGNTATAYEPYAETATITRCGKNLVVYPYDYKTRTINGITFTDNGDGSITIDGTATANATHFLRNQRAWDVKPGADYVGKLHVISGSGEMSWAVNYYKHGTVANYKGWLDVLMNKPDTKPCPDDMGTMATYLIVMAGKTCNNLVVRPQLEAGTTPTEYEPYREPETFAPGEPITAIPGVNTIFADVGLVTATGKANPSAIIEKLTNAILSLGGNV